MVFRLNSYDKILSLECDIYKQLYDESKQRRNQINSKIAPTLTILTTESTATIWLIFRVIKNIRKNNNIIMLEDLCPLILTVTAILSVCIAIIFLIRCLTCYEFSYIDPEKVRKCIQENKNYVQYYSEQEIIYNIQLNIVNSYAENCIWNWDETNKHIEQFKLCYRFIVITLGFLIADFSFVMFL